MTNIILCGGSGTRLWPLSRELMPKQFLSLFGGFEEDLKSDKNSPNSKILNSKNLTNSQKLSTKNSNNSNAKISPNLSAQISSNLNDKKSLFQLCLLRNAPLCEKTLVVLNEEQYFLALDQISALNFGDKLMANILTAPIQNGLQTVKNSQEISQPILNDAKAMNEADLSCDKTISAKAYAKNLHENPRNFSFLLEPLAKNTAAAITLAALSVQKDEICVITPSDHLIKDTQKYAKIIKEAANLAEKNYIVTLGIKPHFANTGFGYIKAAKNGDVKGFYEKPDLKTARKFLKDGNFFWNGGIFVFRAGFFLKEMKKFAPLILKACENALKSAKVQPNLIRITHEKMSQIPENSIDYALMEHSKPLKLIRADMKWSDVGSFDALFEEVKRDENDNAILANSLNLDSKSNFIYSQNPKKLIASADIKKLIIIDTPDALLVCKREKSQRVKELVAALNDEKIRKIHTTAHRPWGSYTVLESEEGYKIKRIEVKPGKKLSLQKHLHRSEHWIVLSGTASVIVGDEKRLVRPNESTYIKVGQIHRLANEGKIPVVLIEAQVGEYTEEDDIIRIEDEFDRV